MSINSGSNGLSYASNYPVPGVDQSSQQFRDNFLIIKNAVEFLQSASSSSSSMFSLASSINSAGAVNYDINYKNNALVLPIGSPTVSPSSGMIRFNSSLSNTEFHDGTAWRPLVYKDSAGAVTMTGRLILNVQPTQPSDAVTLSYVTAQFTNSANALAAQSYATNASVLAVQTDLNNEKVNRIAADTVLQNEINAINQNMANSVGTANSVNGQIASLSLSISNEANARISADTAITMTVNSLNDRVSTAEANVASFSGSISQETTNRIAGDQYLYNIINSVTSSSALSDEIANRIAGDLALANGISTLNSGLLTEKSNRELADASIISSINSLSGQSSDKVYRSGDTMTGDLIMDHANITVESGTLTLANSALMLPKSNLTLDSGQYLLFNAIPNLVGGRDGGFITYDQNNFSYARLDSSTANAVAADIAANGIANANTHWELSCLRIGTTNDPDNGLNNDSIALEPAADLWLNPGWSGGGIANDGTGTPDFTRVTLLSNASVYVGNASTWTIRMVRETGDIMTNGSITAQGDVIGFSDISLKTDIKPIENALDKVEALHGVTYTRIDLPNEPTQMGLIAQEVQAIVPEVVRDVGNDLLGVTYGNLTALLIEAIKELRAEVNELKSRLP